MSLPIFSFTDFGVQSSYLGQLHAAVIALYADAQVITLQADAPRFNPKASAYLLYSLVEYLPRQCVVIGVVDPGVGSDRDALVIRLGQRWFVGPDNGLLAMMAQDKRSLVYRLNWQPQQLSNSFHGRDVFAPVAAHLANGQSVDMSLLHNDIFVGADWPEQLLQAIYVDSYGNIMTGMQASKADLSQGLICQDKIIIHAPTFSAVPEGSLFWYANANGLVEIAQNCGDAAKSLNIAIGIPVSWAT